MANANFTASLNKPIHGDYLSDASLLLDRANGVMLLLASCAHQPTPEAYDPLGFFSGFIHGLLIVPAFIGSLFTDIRIYAFPNSGGWYDFGYLIGAGIFLGSGAPDKS